MNSLLMDPGESCYETRVLRYQILTTKLDMYIAEDQKKWKCCIA